MSTPNLGRLEPVDLREAWEDEARHFTPWLGEPENLQLLGDTIGIELQLEAQEKEVGPFRADLLCKDTRNDHWVLIENQLDRTDHTHLGQLLTYAAGLDAVAIVWVARRITDEHRAALDWLNDVTDERANFFGIEVELWRIADSPVAPKFNVVSKPNEWSKAVSGAAAGGTPRQLTEYQQLQRDFWSEFREHVLDRDTPLKPTRPQPQGWMWLAVGRTGFGLSAVLSKKDMVEKTFDNGEIRAELVVQEEPEDWWERFAQEREALDEVLPDGITWDNHEGKKSFKLYYRRAVDVEDRGAWGDYHAWLREHLEELYRVFSPIVRAASLDDDTPLISHVPDEGRMGISGVS